MTVELLRPDGSLRTMQEIERDVIALALAHVDGNVSRLHRALGVSRSTLYRKLNDADRTRGRQRGLLDGGT